MWIFSLPKRQLRALKTWVTATGACSVRLRWKLHASGGCTRERNPSVNSCSCRCATALRRRRVNISFCPAEGRKGSDYADL